LTALVLYKPIETDHLIVILIPIELDRLGLRIEYVSLQPGVHKIGKRRVLPIILIKFVFKKFGIQNGSDHLQESLIEPCSDIHIRLVKFVKIFYVVVKGRFFKLEYIGAKRFISVDHSRVQLHMIHLVSVLKVFQLFSQSFQNKVLRPHFARVGRL